VTQSVHWESNFSFTFSCVFFFGLLALRVCFGCTPISLFLLFSFISGFQENAENIIKTAKINGGGRALVLCSGQAWKQEKVQW